MAEIHTKSGAMVANLAILAAFASLVLAGWSVYLGMEIRSSRQEIAAQQTSVVRGQKIGQANQKLIELLARAAAQSQDPQLTALLTNNGITFKVNEAKPAQNAGGTP